MRHEAQVLLVHAHAERVGGGDDVETPREEVVLRPHSLRVSEPGVIPAGAQAAALETLHPEIDVLPGGGVDDAGQADLAQQPIEGAGLVGARPARFDGESQIGALEPGHDLQRVRQAKLSGDVGAHLRGRRGRERRGRYTEIPLEVAEAAVIRTKIMPPLADAVRLVHDQADDSGARQGRPERRARQPLWRDVRETQPPRREVGLRRGALGSREPGVHRGRRQAARPQPIDLVLHEGDER